MIIDPPPVMPANRLVPPVSVNSPWHPTSCRPLHRQVPSNCDPSSAVTVQRP
jgi:hypothetical protein